MSHNNVVIVPGWHGSGPTHWQTIWQQNHPEYVRVCQKDWQSTHRADWVLAVNRTVLSLSGNVVLVAHSLGCLDVYKRQVLFKSPTSSRHRQAGWMKVILRWPRCWAWR